MWYKLKINYMERTYKINKLVKRTPWQVEYAKRLFNEEFDENGVIKFGDYSFFAESKSALKKYFNSIDWKRLEDDKDSVLNYRIRRQKMIEEESIMITVT